jgi:hypothetical protein
VAFSIAETETVQQETVADMTAVKGQLQLGEILFYGYQQARVNPLKYF